MIDKELYKTLNDKLPIFFKSWWLDAVCEGGEWCAESHDINGNIDSVFVYFIKKKFGLNYIVMPPLTQFLGEYSFSDNDLKVKKQISRHYIQTLPKTLFTSICMSHSFDYWSPYFWNGFGQTTRYSLRINDLSNVDTVFSNFDGSKQRNIRKADKIMKVDRGMSADDFYAFSRIMKNYGATTFLFLNQCFVIFTKPVLIINLGKYCLLTTILGMFSVRCLLFGILNVRMH